MTELVHFRNRWGRQMVGVFLECKPRTPVEHEHDQRYAAGLEPAHYFLPVPLEHAYAFKVSYIVGLIKEIWDHV